eukprot:EG_transcript_8620
MSAAVCVPAADGCCCVHSAASSPSNASTCSSGSFKLNINATPYVPLSPSLNPDAAPFIPTYTIDPTLGDEQYRGRFGSNTSSSSSDSGRPGPLGQRGGESGGRVVGTSGVHRLNPTAAPFVPKTAQGSPVRFRYSQEDLLALRDRVLAPAAEPVTEDTTKGSPAKDDAPTCFNCSGKHLARDCPNRSPGLGPGVGKCFTCGGNHFARECPTREARIFMRRIGHKCSKAFCQGTLIPRPLNVAI